MNHQDFMVGLFLGCFIGFLVTVYTFNERRIKEKP